MYAYTMPLVVVKTFTIHLKRSSVATSTREREVTLSQIGADHVGQFQVPHQKNHSRRRVGSKLDVKTSTGEEIRYKQYT